VVCTVKETCKKGRIMVKAPLQYQACDERSCLAARRLGFVIPIEVQ
jgi:hypothetical protein